MSLAVVVVVVVVGAAPTAPDTDCILCGGSGGGALSLLRSSSLLYIDIERERDRAGVYVCGTEGVMLPLRKRERAVAGETRGLRGLAVVGGVEKILSKRRRVVG